MSGLWIMLAILTGCLIAGVVVGALIEWCGWWLFLFICVIVTLTVSGKDS